MGGSQQFWTPCKGPLADEAEALEAPAPSAAPVQAAALDPAERDLRFEVEREKLANTLDSLFDRRVAAMEALLPRTEPAPIDHAHEDLLIACASLALGAATAGIGGVLGAAVATGASGALLKEFIKSALKDSVDEQLGASIAGCVSGRLGGTDAREAFFYGAGDALLTAKLATANEVADLRLDAELRATPDPGAVLAEARRGLESQLEAARQVQSHEGLLAWLDFLAKRDLGQTEDGATDMSATHGDQSWQSSILGEDDAEGVLRVQMSGIAIEADKVTVRSARLPGVNEASLGDLAHETPRSAGIPVETDAWFTLANNWNRPGLAEISADDNGRTHVTADETATRWLSLYAQGANESDWPAPPASAELARTAGESLFERLVMNQTFAALGVEVG